MTLTAQQPLNNVVRVTVQALAGVLGGVQSLHTNSLDETLALPSEQAVMVALRTQQILAEESGVTNVVDPLGGSWAIEALTDRMEREARGYIDRIDELGGMVRAIELGYPQKEIAEAAWVYQQQVDRAEKTVVGVNRNKSLRQVAGSCAAARGRRMAAACGWARINATAAREALGRSAAQSPENHARASRRWRWRRRRLRRRREAFGIRGPRL
jgi:methylmalonyl-CoA mutase N-terminal domain/subunit